MAIVNEGLNFILDVQFHGTAAVSPWYVLLKGTGTPAAGDTLASHATWSEVTDYADNRKEFVEGAASGQSISNSGNAASFTMNTTVSVFGAGLCGAATANTAKLFSAVDFTAQRDLINLDVLNVTITITAADS